MVVKTGKKTTNKADKNYEEETTDSPVQRKVLLEWEANTRPYRRLEKEVFSTILAGAFLLGVILFFIEGAIPVIALASLIFLLYVMGTIPPGKVKHAMTSWGMESEDKVWVWEAMSRFWIQGKDSNRMLVIELMGNLSKHIRFMLGDVDEKKLKVLLLSRLVEDQPKPNWLDKASRWVEKKVRLSGE